MINNIVAGIGLACIVYSAVLVSPTLGWFVAGVLCVAVGIGGVILKARSQKAVR